VNGLPAASGAAASNGALPPRKGGAAATGAAPPRKGVAAANGATSPTKAAPKATKKAAPKATKKAAPKAATKSVPAAPTAPPESPNGRTPDVWDERVAGALSFLRRRLTGEYEVDEFGFDPELAAATVYPLLRLLYERYFRVEVTGLEHLPPDGPALIVANHSGTLPMDALMLMMAVHDETRRRRHLRLLGADLVFRVPVLSELARKFGSTLACNPDATRMLRNGEYVGVFPEGFKGIGKPYRDRYKLQRFGRGGFVSAALRTGAPIVPVSIVGAEEIYPILGNLRPLARVTGLPYVPLTPLFPWLGPLGLLPLPSKWLIEFGEPIDTTAYGDDADDPIVVFNLADQVRETIQETLHTLLERRPDPFG
jgi:1-acyl-sn-glycerol-3-phosphate acyltransferase